MAFTRWDHKAIQLQISIIPDGKDERPERPFRDHYVASPLGDPGGSTGSSQVSKDRAAFPVSEARIPPIQCLKVEPHQAKAQGCPTELWSKVVTPVNLKGAISSQRGLFSSLKIQWNLPC